MNITWIDELDPMQLRKLDMVSVAICDGEWNCKHNIEHAVEYQMQFGLWRWVYFCEHHFTVTSSPCE